MKIQASFFCAWLCLGMHGLIAQDSPLVDTFHTPPAVGHVFLNIEIPKGEMKVEASSLCGKSLSKLEGEYAQGGEVLKSRVDANGNLVRTFSPGLGTQLKPKSTQRGLSSSFPKRTISMSDNKKPCRATFLTDPATITDLYLNLGMGSSELDLSALSINSVEIRSAFSNVTLAYTKANRVEMEKMDIHLAKGTVVVKNIELARAHLVNIVNDMGDTKLTIGSKHQPGASIMLELGTGDCTLQLHPGHPCKIILKDGLFSSTQMPTGFRELSKNIYASPGYKSENQAVTEIVCKLDFGKLTVVAHQR